MNFFNIKNEDDEYVFPLAEPGKTCCFLEVL